MNYEQALDKLTKYGQQHLLRFYGELNEAQKKRLLSQIEATDFEVLSSMDAMHKAERGRIAPLEAMQLPEIEKKKEQFRKTDWMRFAVIKSERFCLPAEWGQDLVPMLQRVYTILA